jgi:hypothetical protein
MVFRLPDILFISFAVLVLLSLHGVSACSLSGSSCGQISKLPIISALMFIHLVFYGGNYYEFPTVMPYFGFVDFWTNQATYLGVKARLVIVNSNGENDLVATRSCRLYNPYISILFRLR